MIVYTKTTDELREVGTTECWCLHGAVGAAADWREFSANLADSGIGSRAVDLWRFLENGSASLGVAASALNAEAIASKSRSGGQILVGYSMGGRLALHALLEKNSPWKAAVIIAADPGLPSSEERAARKTKDAVWATQALFGDWQKFLSAWDAQPLLNRSSERPPATTAQLMSRRQEIARSFVDWSLAAQEPLWDRLHEISVPVLWIAGESDEKFRSLAERAVSLMPRAEVAIAPSVGHRVPWETAAWFADTVTRFTKLGCGS